MLPQKIWLLRHYLQTTQTIQFLSQVRQEIDRRIQEKEEEFDHSKKNHARALDSMQASLEAEARAKEEALRQVQRADK